MAEPLDRNEVIRLLNLLGGEHDSTVLEAARALHDHVVAAGLTWDDVVAEPAGTEAEPTAPPAAAETPAAEEPAAKPETGPIETDDDALALIDKLLARTDISDDLRDELSGYKSDITAGEFGESDRRYLAALYERLS